MKVVAIVLALAAVASASSLQQRGGSVSQMLRSQMRHRVTASANNELAAAMDVASGKGGGSSSTPTAPPSPPTAPPSTAPPSVAPSGSCPAVQSCNALNVNCDGASCKADCLSCTSSANGPSWTNNCDYCSVSYDGPSSPTAPPSTAPPSVAPAPTAPPSSAGGACPVPGCGDVLSDCDGCNADCLKCGGSGNAEVFAPDKCKQCSFQFKLQTLEGDVPSLVLHSQKRNRVVAASTSGSCPDVPSCNALNVNCDGASCKADCLSCASSEEGPSWTNNCDYCSVSYDGPPSPTAPPSTAPPSVAPTNSTGGACPITGCGDVLSDCDECNADCLRCEGGGVELFAPDKCKHCSFQFKPQPFNV